MKSSKTLLLLLVLTATLAPLAPSALAAARQPTEPPVFETAFQGAFISVSVRDTWPTTYQWYRGTATAPKKYKIPPPEGIQREIVPRIAGWYFCEATNAMGSTLSEPVQYATTRSKTAPKLKVTERVP